MNRPRSLATLGGGLFVVIGVLGFVPGVTTHYGDLHLGHGSHAQLFGAFRVSILLNAIHILIGTAAIVVARTTPLALAALALWLVGVVAAGGWLSLDAAENWLHLVFAVVLLGLALLVGGEDLADDLERDLGGRLPAEI